VEDAALLFMAMHGPDYRDAQTYAHPPSDVLSGLKSGIAGLRLAVLADEELGEIDSEVTHEFTAALDVLRGLGARIDTLKLPVSFDSMAVIVGKIIAAEGYALHREWIDRTDLPFDADVADRIRWAKNMSAADYVKIMGERKNLRQAIDVLLRDFDGLLLPTSPLPAPPLTAIDQGKAPMSRLTRPINLLDLCAVAIPCGYSAGGLPISMQIAARGYQEARVLRIAWAYENATEWHTRRPAGL
jgi:aspartyl-tRNA(Asn)/glutamyl-tRNA(Gln) amidotransferase subunit A